MKSKIILGLICAMGVCSSVFAAPSVDFNKGSISASLGIPLVDSHYKVESFDKHYGYGDVTVGLGGNLALNYRHNGYNADGTDIRFRSNEYNVMYKVLPNVAVYGGYIEGTASSEKFGREVSKDQAQIGARVSLALPLLFTVWADGAYSSDMKGFELGISRPIMNNLDLDVAYFNENDKIKGVKTGLTVKF